MMRKHRHSKIKYMIDIPKSIDLRITKDDLDEQGLYKHSASIEITGTLIIDAGLGWVKFSKSLSAKVIIALPRSGIECGEGIECVWGI